MLVTASSVANSIRLARTQVQGPFVIAEGPRDSRVYRRSLHEDAHFVVGFGRANVLGAIALLEADGIGGVLGVVDADFAGMTGGPEDLPNVLHTDVHDLEVMLLTSPALEKILDVFGSLAKITSFEDARQMKVRQALFETATPLGLLRWLSTTEALGLDFDDLTLSRFINRSDLMIDVSAMVGTVLNHSMRHDLDADSIADQIREAMNRNPDPAVACCGHDMVAVLSLGLTRALGSRSAAKVSHDTLEAALEIAYEADWLRTTGLHVRLCGWESRNPGLRLTR